MENRLKMLNEASFVRYAQPTMLSFGGSRVVPTIIRECQHGLCQMKEALQYSPSGDPALGGINHISRIGLLWSCSACPLLWPNPTGLSGYLDELRRITFILAEVEERGFISSGTLHDYYKNGIKAFLGVTYKERYENG